MYWNLSNRIFTVWLGVGVLFAAGHAWAEPVTRQPACRVVQQDKQVELCSPLFVFRLDTANGLQGPVVGEPAGGKNAQAGRRTGIGDRRRPARSSAANAAAEGFRRSDQQSERNGRSRLHTGGQGAGRFRTVTYRWDAKQPVLRQVCRDHQQERPRAGPPAERPPGELSHRRQDHQV